MSLQELRRAVEEPIAAAFAALVPPIPVYVENQSYSQDDAASEFALVRLQWGLMNEPSIGCGPGELLRGVVIVEVFTPKAAGPGRGQEAITPVLQALAGLSGLQGARLRMRAGQIEGPRFTALDGRPHFMTAVSAPIKASFDA